jgi:hypothetical protein
LLALLAVSAIPLWRSSGITVPGWAQNALQQIATDLLLAALLAE